MLSQPSRLRSVLRAVFLFTYLLAACMAAAYLAGVPESKLFSADYHFSRLIAIQASLVTVCTVALFPEIRSPRIALPVRLAALPIVQLSILFVCATLATTTQSSVIALTRITITAALWTQPSVLIRLAILLFAGSLIENALARHR